MYPKFTVIPRYQLDDSIQWLEGVDPLRNYWIAVNGDRARITTLAGVKADSFEEFKQIIRRFRALQPGEEMFIGNSDRPGKIICISANCYAYESNMEQAPVWHLFDEESLDSLLMTAHPDWQCSQKDLLLGRSQLEASWETPAVA
ncbi:MAG: hypothetical protein BRC33_08835 [Cyanobacteria bacterium SW_9_44_58]|nr:MAG: hypothetical protein BRC33_08835 [Cyanobacteria bacterium SW_9_44_58]